MLEMVRFSFSQRLTSTFKQNFIQGSCSPGRIYFSKKYIFLVYSRHMVAASTFATRQSNRVSQLRPGTITSSRHACLVLDIIGGINNFNI